MNSNKKILLASTYFICFSLVSIYFFILFLPPSVCIEYKLYYIDRTLTEWPGYGGLHCDFGQKVSMSLQQNGKTDRHAGLGWGNREDNFRWSVGNTSILYFTTEYNNDMLIIFEVGGVVCSHFNVFINNELVGSSENIDNNLLICKFSGENSQNNLFEVKFEISDPVRPCDVSESNDTRELGFQLVSFSLSEDNTN